MRAAQNCGTTAHAFRKRGYCVRCWPCAEFREQIDSGAFPNQEGPNGWASAARWRAELRAACEVNLHRFNEQERLVRGELELTAWHLHLEIEHFERTFKLGYARGTGLVTPRFPDAEARRVIYTWLIDWESGHRLRQLIDDLVARVREHITYEYLRNGSQQVQ
jgi:hypothetical protein